MTEKSGLPSAIEALDPGAPPGEEAEQLPLLPLAPVGRGEDLPAEGAPRGPGRPSGARNRRTQEWLDFLQARYPSPLVALAEIMSRPVGDLVVELDCTRKEALAFQVDAMKALLPYWHQKQPLAVQLDAKGVVQLLIQTGPDSAMPGDAGIVTIEGEIADPESEENQ